VHTILRAAAQQTQHISVPANDFHHFHFLNQVGHVTVAAVIYNKIMMKSFIERIQCVICVSD